MIRVHFLMLYLRYGDSLLRVEWVEDANTRRDYEGRSNFCEAIFCFLGAVGYNVFRVARCRLRQLLPVARSRTHVTLELVTDVAGF